MTLHVITEPLLLQGQGIIKSICYRKVMSYVVFYSLTRTSFYLYTCSLLQWIVMLSARVLYFIEVPLLSNLFSLYHLSAIFPYFSFSFLTIFKLIYSKYEIKITIRFCLHNERVKSVYKILYFHHHWVYFRVDYRIWIYSIFNRTRHSLIEFNKYIYSYWSVLKLY